MSNLKPPIETTQGGTGVTTITGVLSGNGTVNITGSPITQYNALVGGASNAITSVAPGVTGIPLISQGVAANPAFGTVVVGGGGTGATTLTGVLTGNGTSAVTANAVTQYGAVIAGASNAVTSVAPGATGIPLVSQGVASNPAFSTAQVAGGGTGLTTYTTGDLLYASAANTLSKLPITTQVGVPLFFNGTNVAWYNPRKHLFYYDDFIAGQIASNLGWGGSTFNGGGQSASSSTNADKDHPGILSLTTGTATNGGSGVDLGATAMTFGGGTWYLEFISKITVLSDATDTFKVRIGFGDNKAASDFAEGVYFEYEDAGATPNWIIKTSDNSVRSSTTTSTAVTTNWVKLGILVNADATLATYYVDDVSVGTQSTNIPTASTRLCTPTINIHKSAGTTSRNITTDICWFSCILTNTR